MMAPLKNNILIIKLILWMVLLLLNTTRPPKCKCQPSEAKIQRTFAIQFDKFVNSSVHVKLSGGRQGELLPFLT